jgi:hypothetical protein
MAMGIASRMMDDLLSNVPSREIWDESTEGGMLIANHLFQFPRAEIFMPSFRGRSVRAPHRASKARSVVSSASWLA